MRKGSVSSSVVQSNLTTTTTTELLDLRLVYIALRLKNGLSGVQALKRQKLKWPVSDRC